jgi:hypothetical protein
VVQFHSDRLLPQLKAPVVNASNANSHGLFGTWKLISNRIRMEDTGDELDLFGADPRGVRRMTAILTTAEQNQLNGG